MKHIHTTAGPLGFDDFGLALPHEHIFTETGEAPAWAYLDAGAKEVLPVMKPLLLAAREKGVTLICEATPCGVGRRADIVRAVARESGMPVTIATGFYREPWITEKTYAAGLDELAAYLTSELDDHIKDTDVRAGFIKLGTSDEGMTTCEEKLLRAACHAVKLTGATICSHTVNGHVANRALDILEEEGITPTRYVWFHASAERDHSLLTRAGKRGAFLSIDYDPDTTLPLLLRLLAEGFQNQILLSMDSGWYNPRFVDGGNVRGYTRMIEELFPKLPGAGVDEQALKTITHDNVFEAYAR